MGFKFLIVDAYYPEYLRKFTKERQQLELLTYGEHRRILMNECFGTADFYSSNLKRIGHEGEDIVANDIGLQTKWAMENGVKAESGFWREVVATSFDWMAGRDMTRRLLVRCLEQYGRGANSWLYEVLAAQIRKTRPDVLYVLENNILSDSFLGRMKRYVRMSVAQIACPLPQGRTFANYDLVITSFPHFVSMFRQKGKASEYLRLGFEPRILERLGSRGRDRYDVVFVGGYSRAHGEGVALLEQVCERVPIEFWGCGIGNLDETSGILKRYHGEAYGLQMYKIYSEAKIALNRHIDVAGGFANNMRLYETTGVGTMLVTDDGENLGELFTPGREVVVYHDAAECAEKLEYYLSHQEERMAIAEAGQRRTLREHTYFHRMQELVEIIRKYMK